MPKIKKNTIEDFSDNLASEIEQSIMRLAVALGTSSYLLFWVHPQHLDDTSVSTSLIIIYGLLSLLLYLFIKLSPAPKAHRIIAGILLDVSILSIFMGIGENWVLSLSWIYLIIIIGNGFRYGARYLDVSLAFSLIGFTLASAYNMFWQENLVSMTGVYLSLLVLPFYIRMLLSRLTDAIEAAKESTKTKSLFLANMSHEIRTPMNGILGMLELSLNEKLSKPLRERLEIAQGSANSLLVLINDILDLSKVEAGKINFETVDFSAKRLIHDIVGLLKQRAEEKGISLNYSFNSDIDEHLKGDPTRIRQTIMNLIGNAIKFTENGGVTVYISLKEKDECVRLSCKVCDSGIGISPKAQQHIFDYFTQADNSTTRKFGGTGLGLALSQRLIQEMGGKIGVDSTLGKGSIFWFTLPLQAGEVHEEDDIKQPDSLVSQQETTTAITTEKKPELENPSDSQNKDEANKLNILLAEDNPVNQIVIKQMLSTLDCDVTIMANGRLLINKIREKPNHHFDLIFMDCQMPVMDGYAATEYLQEYWRLHHPKYRIPIIALTANAMPSDKQKCLDAGMDDYLSKPVHMDSLSDIIKKWAEKRDNRTLENAA